MGVISGTTLYSLECMLPYNGFVARSISRMILSMALPVMAIAFYMLVWEIISWKNGKSFTFFIRRSLLSFFAVIYLTYVSITRMAMSIVSCIRVYDSTFFGSNDFSYRWYVDPSIRCYSGSHAFLSGFLGWPTILLVSIGLPCLLWYILNRNPSARSVGNWINDTTGFLYRAYSENFVYWESVIMIRKALLTVVAVNGYEMGPLSQVIVAVCILVFAHQLHHICQPFREEFKELNDYEGHALFVSLFVYILGVFFLDDDRTVAENAALSVFLFFLICGLFIYLSTKLFWTGIDYVRLSLIVNEVPLHPQINTIEIIRRFVKHKIDHSITELTKFLSTLNRISQRSFEASESA